MKSVTKKELADHSTKESLWLLIEDSIYDVTKFMEEHPGGEEVLLEQAGKDATEPFSEVGHSADAKDLMKDFKIGELCEEERKKSDQVSSSCCWCRGLIAAGVTAVVSFAVYKYYVLNK